MSPLMWLIALILLGGMLYWDRKKINKLDYGAILDAVKEARFRDYVYGFMIFLGVFLIARSFAIGQTIAQTCEVWENQDYGGHILMYGDNGEIVDFGYASNFRGNIEDLDQGRSYNYYRRYFNACGGRPGNVNINCSWNIESFIKNIELDYLSREFALKECEE